MGQSAEDIRDRRSLCPTQAALGLQHPQRLYLDCFKRSTSREDTLRGDVTRGENVFYTLGRFSQVISEYEQIDFATEPQAKYEGFAKRLEHQPRYYYAD